MELSVDNAQDYLKSIISRLPFKVDRIVQIEEVTEETYVNWIYKATLATTDGEVVVYLRQTRDHVKRKPDMKMDPRRIGFEVKILSQLQKIIPGVVPEVLYYDEENNIAVLSDVKRGAFLLVNELVKGEPHPETGNYFGAVIAQVHGKTKGIQHGLVRGSVANNEAALSFHLGMRTKPALERYPEITRAFLEHSRQFHQHLVLGDLASKNIFVDGAQVRFLDLERAFIGDSAFDLAFLFCHYLIEVPRSSLAASVKFITDFITSYKETLQQYLSPSEVNGIEARTVRFLGVTTLYRVHGFYLAVNAQANADFWDTWAYNFLSRDYTSLGDALQGVSK